jgi:uncharacterized protein (DUF1800 family)
MLENAVVILLLVAAGPATAGPAAQERATLRLPPSPLDETERIVHAMNRLGYGPRPGEVERIRAQGLDRWLTAQLYPETVDDPDVERRLAAFETLELSQAELLARFPPPSLLRGIASRMARPLQMDRAELARLFPELAAFDRARRRRDADAAPADPPPGSPARRPQAPQAPQTMNRMLDGPGLIGAELAQAKLVRSIYSERQLEQVLVDFWFNHFNVFIGKGQVRWMIGGYERDAIRPHVLGSFRDLLGATASHPAMLFYLDNWQSAAEGAVLDGPTRQLYGIESIERQGLPPGGVATLILRDRGLDTAELEQKLRRQETYLRYRRNRARARRSRDPLRDAEPERRGLNENYARELLELHTLGVDGGYSQRDVVEVARCFSGWTLTPMLAAQQFVFMPELHASGKKEVLGKKVKGGRREGEAVLDLLAEHPSTARFVSTKLATRFVSDRPPPALVERMAETFLASDGDLRAVMRTLIESEEFWSADAYRAKVKSPFELVVSAVRATGGELSPLAPPASAGLPAGMDREAVRDHVPGLLHVLNQLGQPPYRAQPPTGYGDTAETWVSSGALLDRMKFSLGLAVGRIPGVEPNVPGGLSAERLGRIFLGRDPAPATLAAIEEQLELAPHELEALGLPPGFFRGDEPRSKLLAGWLLASAEFQRR